MGPSMRRNLPRRRSFNEPGHAHELTFSCYHRYPFLKADRTCRWLAESIDGVRAEHDVQLWAYVFMPDHVHLIVLPRAEVYDMSVLLRAIKEPVGRRAARYLVEHAPEWLPRITQVRGSRTERHFWQPGG